MTRHVMLAAAASLLAVSCTPTPAPRVSTQAATAAPLRKPKPMPSLDRTYDWGSRPPTQSPDREQD